jgi:hypothetical protein
MLIRLRLSRALLATGCVTLLVSAVPAYPQSLGDVARREAERRKELARTAGRVYTNEDLGAVEAPLTLAQPSQAESAIPTQEQGEASGEPTNTGPTVMEEDPVTHKINVRTAAPAREKRTEPYWRGRAKELRGRLAKSSADLAAAQSGLSALEGGPQTPATVRERAVAAAMVERLQEEVRSQQLDVTKLQMQAEMNKVPAEWIR